MDRVLVEPTQRAVLRLHRVHPPLFLAPRQRTKAEGRLRIGAVAASGRPQASPAPCPSGQVRPPLGGRPNGPLRHWKARSPVPPRMPWGAADLCFDRVRRKWDFYLAYGEAGLRNGCLNVVQFVSARSVSPDRTQK